jgi:SAM-dependent methyltransferase/uncharacterized protein YbaR (Trm112 family)
MKPDSLLLDILADPVDLGRLAWNNQAFSLDNVLADRRYTFKNGIPALLTHVPVISGNDELPLATQARYDGLSDWYDNAMQAPESRGPLAEAAFKLLTELLGPGCGTVVDVGCGTGLSAEHVRRLGYSPVGIDLSLDMLTHARRRMPVAQGNAARLPMVSGSVAQAFSTFTTTDWDDLPGALAEIARILSPQGRYINLGVHPCFYGSFSEALPDGSVRQLPGYRASHFRPPEKHQGAVRSRVGAWHWSVADLINQFVSAGLRVTRIVEGGAQALPELFAICAVKAAD